MNVTALVLAIILTGTTPEEFGSQKGPWRARKERYLAQLRQASDSSRLVAACDKRQNLGDLVGDLRHEGDATALVGAKAQVSDTVELHTHTEVDGMMQCIRKHLAPGGEAILNTFAPRGGYEALKAFWSKRDGTTPCWTKPDGDYTLSMADDCTVFQENPVAAFPRLIYRRHDKAAELVDEQVLEIVMRVWQPDELLALIERHGFTITQKLGGYNGEAWGDGPELVVSFTH